MRVGFRHEHRVDRVVNAARAAQSHHIPVIYELRLRDRQHEDAWLACTFDDAESVDMRCVLDAGSKAPRPFQAVSPIHGNGRAGPCALSRDYGKAIGSKELSNGSIAEVCAASTD